MYVRANVHMYVCTYVRMYECTNVCMRACMRMYACMYVYVRPTVCLSVRPHVRARVCACVRMYVFIYVCMHASLRAPLYKTAAKHTTTGGGFVLPLGDAAGPLSRVRRMRGSYAIRMRFAFALALIRMLRSIPRARVLARNQLF